MNLNWNNIKDRLSQFNIAEKLIVINILLFILPIFLSTVFFLFKIDINLFYSLFELSSNFNQVLFKPWTLLTYSFFHGSFGHLFWNMILLYYAGRFFLNLFPWIKFINVYFLGVLFGGIIFVLSYQLFPVFAETAPSMIGASAGIMAVLIFMCTYSPQMIINIFFFKVALKYIGIALVVIDVIQIPNGNAGGHIAHIGGALLGYFYATNLKKGVDIGSKFEKTWKYIFIKPDKEFVKKQKETKKKQSNQQRVDEILDKISAKGYDNLTKEEKQFLFSQSSNKDKNGDSR